MSKVEKIIGGMRASPGKVRFSDLARVCRHYFGAGRKGRGSHLVFTTGISTRPLVNIQEGEGGMAKKYQVKQALRAIDMQEDGHASRR